MAIPNPEAARYNSFQEFLSRTKGRDNAPSFTNLFSVRFGTPPMMRTPLVQSGPSRASNLQIDGTNDLDWLLDYLSLIHI